MDKKQELYSINPSNKVYRYQLFAKLLFWRLWKGELLKGDRFLNIDEGQDLAPIEYRLFKDVNGADLIFNIYGDINQTITSKGIRDWSSLEGIDQLFTLNENYRNTEQITEFCNNELGFSFTSIGVSGSEVRIKPLSDVLKEIKQKAEGSHDKRCAVIVNDYKHVTVKKWISHGCAEGIIQKGLISLLSVEDSKGLEFEEVYVVDENMTKKEKYISFTRALENLTIVRL